MVSTPRLAREALFSADMPAEVVRRYFSRLQDDSYRAYLGMLGLNLPRPERVNTPVQVLGAAGDYLISPGEVEATARAYQTQANIVPDMAHDVMLEVDGRQ